MWKHLVWLGHYSRQRFWNGVNDSQGEIWYPWAGNGLLKIVEHPEKEIASMGTFTLASLQRSRLFAALIAHLLRAKLPTQGQMLKATPTPRADLVQ